jgi:UDP-N-acetylmuramoyl-L-alanyl-D-glutamate--2,6-diaminopimelate ligase
MKCADGEYRVSLPNFAGEFQVMNSLQAASVASVMGISCEDIQNAFLNMSGVCGRLERVVAHPKQEIEIYIDYAHTPDALCRLIESVRGFRKTGSRIVLLFGCGGDRDRDKRWQMGQIASRLSDMVIISSDNSRSEDPSAIICDILKGIDKEKRYVVIEDRVAAIEQAIKEYTRKGDILILAGKGHEKYQICSDGVRELDERKIISEVFNDLYR